VIKIIEYYILTVLVKRMKAIEYEGFIIDLSNNSFKCLSIQCNSNSNISNLIQQWQSNIRWKYLQMKVTKVSFIY